MATWYHQYDQTSVDDMEEASSMQGKDENGYKHGAKNV
jgi:hypothetical protein